MSDKNRFYDAVWTGLREISHLVDAKVCNFVTVGEVAKSAKVSRQTARKYLDLLSETPYVGSVSVGGHMFYRMIIVEGD